MLLTTNELESEARSALLYTAASALSAFAQATYYVVPGGLGWVHFSFCEREMRDEIREIRASERARDLRESCERERVRVSGSESQKRRSGRDGDGLGLRPRRRFWVLFSTGLRPILSSYYPSYFLDFLGGSGRGANVREKKRVVFSAAALAMLDRVIVVGTNGVVRQHPCRPPRAPWTGFSGDTGAHACAAGRDKHRYRREDPGREEAVGWPSAASAGATAGGEPKQAGAARPAGAESRTISAASPP